MHFHIDIEYNAYIVIIHGQTACGHIALSVNNTAVDAQFEYEASKFVHFVRH